MAKKTKDKFMRNRKSVIFLVCEGRNKTECTYFNHFKNRNINLYLKCCESTDIQSMADKALSLFNENNLDRKLNDHVFCLIDLDLNKNKFDKLQEIKSKKKYKNVEFIVSNPCFEIWLLYHFLDNPKVESSSQAVKSQLKKNVPNYSESMDIFQVSHLKEKLPIALTRAEIKNSYYIEKDILYKNPYTEVQTMLSIILELSR